MTYYIFALLVLIIISKGLYNRYLHPLRNFPGPFWGGVSDFYLVYMIASVPTYGLDLHAQYGPVVRLSPNLLSFCDPKLLPVVYHRYADKPQFYGSWMFGHTEAMFQSLKHQDHYAKKKLVAPSCSMTAMKQFHERKISERVVELCECMGERAANNGSIDFSEHLRWFLSDTWSHLVYGQPLGWVKKGADIKGLIDSLTGVYGLSASAAVMPWLMPLFRHPFLRKHVWCYTNTFKNMANLYSHFDEMIDNRNALVKKDGERLFFDGLEPSLNPNEYQYTRNDLKAEIITFTAATLDGAAAAISPFIDNMLQHPEHFARVVAEIETADRAGKLSSPCVTYEETLELPFFMACIKETLRRDSPAQTILPRIVSSPGYDLPNGMYIPPGAHMGASPFIIHRSAEIFGANPDCFVPSRWIIGEGRDVTEASIKRMEKYGMWWGYGDRECAGKYYAVMEFQKLVVEMLRRFDIKSAVAEGEDRFLHKRWAVGMFWGQMLSLKQKEFGEKLVH
ncbi:hypothetical protein HYALB_00012979 [Hymenoscyphus albidus]|uniref:Cytochrome P450 n=1 Tax=Hymenoscyphus albidus TaxID=595503 RepID=A0A9N9LRJ2_9HELO|nr:hypothetical protein HYALB_00012979 [Hymenoscyphus albidus]